MFQIVDRNGNARVISIHRFLRLLVNQYDDLSLSEFDLDVRDNDEMVDRSDDAEESLPETPEKDALDLLTEIESIVNSGSLNYGTAPSLKDRLQRVPRHPHTEYRKYSLAARIQQFMDNPPDYESIEKCIVKALRNWKLEFGPIDDLASMYMHTLQHQNYPAHMAMFIRRLRDSPNQISEDSEERQRLYYCNDISSQRRLLDNIKFIKYKLQDSMELHYSNERLIRNLRPLHESFTRLVRKIPRFYFVGDGLRQSRSEIENTNPVRIDIVGINQSCPSIYATCLEALDIHEGNDVLDIGCGTGYLTAIMAELVGPKGRILGIDLNDHILNFCIQNIKDYDQDYNSNLLDRCYFQKINAFNLVDSEFDRIYCGGEVDEQQLNHFKQLLKPGGIIVAPVEGHLVKIRRSVLSEAFEEEEFMRVMFGSITVPDEDDDTKWFWSGQTIGDERRAEQTARQGQLARNANRFVDMMVDVTDGN